MNENAVSNPAAIGPIDSFVVRKRAKAKLAASLSPVDCARVVVRGWTTHVAAIAR